MSDDQPTWPKPVIDKLVAKFLQDGNTLGTTDETEALTIRLECQLPDEPPFYVLETSGWSFDDIADMEKLIEALRSAWDGFTTSETLKP